MTDQEIQEKLNNLAGWSIQNQKLHKKFEFQSFNEAFGFMTRVALKAETMNHHPDWINNYNRVTVELFTHDTGQLTQADFDLARFMDQTTTN